MTTIIIKNQKELDDLPDRFDQYTRIEIRSTQKIYVNKARENSSVVARENSSVVARENSSVEAWGNSSVEAWGNSSVEAWGNSSVVARENSSVEAWGNSSVVAWDNSSVVAWENSSVVAFQFSMIAVLMATVIIKHLADYSVASIRGFIPNILKKDDTATVIQTPKELNISFETWLERGWVIADGIHLKLVSQKTIKDTCIFTVKDWKKQESYVVKRGDLFSHGDTVEKAIEDLRYKISDRDTTRFKDWKLEDKISVEDAIQSYRAITGACEFGVKDFCKGIELPETITVEYVIEKTKGQFGNDKYCEFFVGKV